MARHGEETVGRGGRKRAAAAPMDGRGHNCARSGGLRGSSSATAQLVVRWCEQCRPLGCRCVNLSHCASSSLLPLFLYPLLLSAYFSSSFFSFLSFSIGVGGCPIEFVLLSTEFVYIHIWIYAAVWCNLERTSRELVGDIRHFI